YLAHPEECAHIADQGLAFIQNHLRQADACQKFLDEVVSMEEKPAGFQENGTLAPAIPLPDDSVPFPLPEALSEQFSKGAARNFFQALRRDLRRPKTDSTPGESEEEADGPPALDLADRQEIIAKREAYHARWMKQEEMRRRGQPFFELHDNAEYRAS